MRLEVLDEAEDEFVVDKREYESREPGLGDRFAQAVDECFENIKSWPDVFKQLRGGYRQRGVKVFPYAVIYKVHNEAIYVIAIAPCRRRPYYWKRRRIPG